MNLHLNDHFTELWIISKDGYLSKIMPVSSFASEESEIPRSFRTHCSNSLLYECQFSGTKCLHICQVWWCLCTLQTWLTFQVRIDTVKKGYHCVIKLSFHFFNIIKDIQGLHIGLGCANLELSGPILWIFVSCRRWASTENDLWCSNFVLVLQQNITCALSLTVFTRWIK